MRAPPQTEGNQKVISGRNQNAAMKSQIRLRIGAAIHPGSVHFAIGPLDTGKVGIGAMLRADRAGFGVIVGNSIRLVPLHRGFDGLRST
jgi:hypothetical protein